MIDYKTRTIFVHIPKCGGTSIENALFAEDEKTERNLFSLKGHPKHDFYEQGGLQHLSALKIREIVGKEVFEKCFKFALVRNPIERLISQYNYTNQFIDFYQYLNLKPNNFTFNEYLWAINMKYHVHWRPQHEFIYEGSKLLVDEVYKLEEINDGKIAKKLNKQIPHHNKSTKYIHDITENDEKIVRQMYAKDFELLDY